VNAHPLNIVDIVDHGGRQMMDAVGFARGVEPFARYDHGRKAAINQCLGHRIGLGFDLGLVDGRDKATLPRRWLVAKSAVRPQAGSGWRLASLLAVPCLGRTKATPITVCRRVRLPRPVITSRKGLRRYVWMRQAVLGRLAGARGGNE
jgi:hypothetical protein